MKESEPKQTPAFGLALFIFFIIFIIVLNQLPFPPHYEFWQLAGITFATIMVTAIIYGIAAGLVEAIFKIFVEIAAALLLLADAIYVAALWSMFDAAKLYFNLETWPTIFVLAVILFFTNLLIIFVLYPLSRIAGTSLTE